MKKPSRCKKVLPIGVVLASLVFPPCGALAETLLELSGSAGAESRSGGVSAAFALDSQALWHAGLDYHRTTTQVDDQTQWADQFLLGLDFAPAVWQFSLEGAFNRNDQAVNAKGLDLGVHYTWLRTTPESEDVIASVGIGWGFMNYTASVPVTYQSRRVTVQQTQEVSLRQNHPHLSLELPLFTPRVVLVGAVGTYTYSDDPQALNLSVRRTAVSTDLTGLTEGLLEREWQSFLAYSLTERMKVTVGYARQKLVAVSDWSSNAQVGWEWQSSRIFTWKAEYGRLWPSTRPDFVTVGMGLQF